jgi:hypothetical protein
VVAKVMMSNPKSPSSHLDDVQVDGISLNRGSSLFADSLERSFLDAISNFKFVECHGLATALQIYRESDTEQHLVVTDLFDWTLYLARTVIAYSHLFTFWQRVVSGKSKSKFNDLDKWLTYRLVIGYTFIDQGMRHSKLDRKDSDLSENMPAHALGYTGCSMDDFDKHGERRSKNFRFRERFSEKAMSFFKRNKYQKDLLQHIRNYMNHVHEEYMKTIRLMDLTLFDVSDLRNPPFSDLIEMVPLHFKIAHWELLYNDGKALDEGGIKQIMERIEKMPKSPVDRPAKSPSQATKPTNV